MSRSDLVLFEANPQPMWIYDPETLRFLAVNDAAIAHYGYSRQEFLTMTIADIRPVEDRPALHEYLARTSEARIPEGVSKAGVWRHRLRNGRIIHVQISSHALDFEGRRARLVMAHDVTAIHLANEDLREVASRFESFMEYLPGVAFIKDEAGRYVYVNAAWETLFDKTATDALGETDERLFPPAMAAQFRRNDLQVMASGEASLVYEQVEQRDGVHYWLVSKFPIEDDGQSARLLGGTAIDITRQHTAEQELRNQTEQLRQAHELLSFHVDNSPLAVIEWDHEFRVRRWSRQSEVFFGWGAEEIIGRHPHDWAFVHPDDAATVDATMAELLRGTAPRNPTPNRNLTRTGEVLYCEWYNSVRLDERGRVVSIFSLVHDITGRVHAEAELHRLNSELERRVEERTTQLAAINKELESFSYSVSHDLRAPLRGIAGFARALEEHADAVLDETGRGYLQRVRNAADRMGQLIDDLLQLSRLSRAEMHIEPVDLSTLAAAIVDELRQLEPERRVEATIAPDVLVQGDARLLRILLQNLLGNAWKFSAKNPEARIEFGIRYSATDPPECFVHDNGVGFDMRYSHQLFSAFQRLHAQTEFPGTGIGLATVQRIIARHDGRIRAVAEPGRGATFYFVL